MTAHRYWLLTLALAAVAIGGVLLVSLAWRGQSMRVERPQGDVLRFPALVLVTVYDAHPAEGGSLDTHGKRLATWLAEGVRPCAVHPRNPWRLRRYDTVTIDDVLYTVLDLTAAWVVPWTVDLFVPGSHSRRELWRRGMIVANIERRTE